MSFNVREDAGLRAMFGCVEVLVVVVAFRNPDDIKACLESLAKMPDEPKFTVAIVCNGGHRSYENIIDVLSAAEGPCDMQTNSFDFASEDLSNSVSLTLKSDGRKVIVGCAVENLGYAGGINAWLRWAQKDPGITGIWVLNPDTHPNVHALEALIACARERGKGMVGSRIVFDNDPGFVGSRGLRWRRLMASTKGVDMRAPVLPAPDPADIEARIDSPSGASFYVTRACLDRIGLMDDRYFLYFEDLDWGLRAKATVGVGYAYESIVPHVGGSTIGSAEGRAKRSPLSVYLESRNRIFFVRQHFQLWTLWTTIMIFVRSFEFLAVGSKNNFCFSLRGLWAGLRGETGRPDHVFAFLADPDAPRR